MNNINDIFCEINELNISVIGSFEVCKVYPKAEEKYRKHLQTLRKEDNREKNSLGVPFVLRGRAHIT